MTVQSAVVQQVVSAMQALLAVQTLCPFAQPQVPPAAEQVWPVTVQSVVVQQALFAMQALLAEQAFWPVGSRAAPPGAEQVCQRRQSVVVQHALLAMQAPDAVQTSLARRRMHSCLPASRRAGR